MTSSYRAAHPYMPNSVPGTQQEMLDAIGASSIEELFEQIPLHHRLRRPLNLPRALRSEAELRRHMRDTLAKNETCDTNLSFLGGGCWQHHVPAICDELVARAEFLTPVWGTPASDHGRNQTWFEFCSQIGELVGMDFVGLPVYSWGCAAGHAIRMAARITGRHEVLVPRSIDPERLAVMRTFCEPPEMHDHIDLTLIQMERETGRLDLDDLERKLSSATAAVYFDNPAYIGVIEVDAAEIAAMARRFDAQVIVGVDPISLGVLAAPADYGADLVVGTMQPLGLHMNCGGGSGGFIASRDDERYARQYPTLNLTMAPTVVAGERGFGMTLFEQSSYGSRERGNDWTGNSVYLWMIAGAAYLALAGPAGLREVGEVIVQRSHYAARSLNAIDGVAVVFEGGHFKEFVVNFDGLGKSVSEVNSGLRAYGIFGGRDLSSVLPDLGESALYCVTEVHTREDIDRLTDAITEVTRA